MKTIDVAAAALLVIGGLNWGLVGLFGFDLVAALLGEASVPARAVYATVGLAAVWQALGFRAIQSRWEMEPAPVRARG